MFLANWMTRMSFPLNTQLLINPILTYKSSCLNLRSMTTDTIDDVLQHAAGPLLYLITLFSKISPITSSPLSADTFVPIHLCMFTWTGHRGDWGPQRQTMPLVSSASGMQGLRTCRVIHHVLNLLTVYGFHFNGLPASLELIKQLNYTNEQAQKQ